MKTTKTKLFVDLETRSTLDIRKVGQYKYTENATILLLAYAFGEDGKVKLWDKYHNPAMPEDLREALEDDKVVIVAHNAEFEWLMLRNDLGLDIKANRLECTAAIARSAGMPGKLGSLCQRIGLDTDFAKAEKQGKALINLFSKPFTKISQKKPLPQDGVFIKPFGDEWLQFGEYCKQDVVAMQQIYKILPRINWKEQDQRMYHLNCKVNDRGVKIDLPFVEKVTDLLQQESARDLEKLTRMTNGQFNQPRSVAKLLAYTNARWDLTLTSACKAVKMQIIQSAEYPESLRQFMTQVLKITSSSTAKYDSMKQSVTKDGRVKGGLVFRGTHTGRLSGTGVQMQNLPRGANRQRLKMSAEDIDHFIEQVTYGGVGEIDDFFKDKAIASLRSTFIPEKDHTFIVADLSNIEGRILAWLCGDQDKLKAFKDYDDKVPGSYDVYVITAATMLNKLPEDVTKEERDLVGKVSELSFGYGGGVGAIMQQPIDLEALGIKLKNSITNEIYEYAEDAWLRWGQSKISESMHRRGLIPGDLGYVSKDAWITAECLKKLWRDRNTKAVAFWNSCEEAYEQAVRDPGEVFELGNHCKVFTFSKYQRLHLAYQLASGFSQLYLSPEAVPSVYGKSKLIHAVPKVRDSVYCINKVTYGGSITENLCQSLAASVLQDIMLRLDKKFKIVYSVHDEVIIEVPNADNPQLKLEEVLAEMSKAPSWVPDKYPLPLAATGFTALRYRKG